MKKLCILLILISSSIHLFAQFKLSGNIKNYTGHAVLKINIPVVYGIDDADAITIPVAKDGSFSVTLPVKTQKFATLVFQQNFHLILLTAGKNLNVELSENTKDFKPVAGTALPENAVLQTVNVEEYPFFLQNDEAYTGLSLPALNEKLVKPYFAMRDKKIALVNHSSISPKDKKLIASELKAAAYNNLYELTLLGGQYKQKLDELAINAFDKADPKPEALPAGPQYYLFANNYLWYKQAKAFAIARAQNLKPDAQLPSFGITIAQANSYVNKYNDVYMHWLAANLFLPDKVTEQLGYLLIDNALKKRNKDLVNQLVKEYDQKFPAGMYKADIKREVAKLEN